MSEQTPAGASKPATRKPAARKKATGPTKAAALKKLGLTQEDLDTLKQLAEARKAAAEARESAVSGTLEVDAVVERAEPELVPVDVDTKFFEEASDHAHATARNTEAQQEAKLKAYDALREAGLEIPADLKAEVEAYVAQKTESAEPQAGPWFVRNRRNVEFRMRLDRQKSGTKSTTLKPRGQRGDLVKLQAEDLEDDTLIANVELGIIEIIPLQEAKSILAKQATNQQQAVHPAMAMLRNELGKPYEQSSVEVVGDNTYTVARLEPQGGEAGNIPGPKRGVDWEAARNLGGNPAIISDGFADESDRAAAADAIARRKDIEGPAAGLGGLSFGGLDPVQRA